MRPGQERQQQPDDQGRGGEPMHPRKVVRRRAAVNVRLGRRPLPSGAQIRCALCGGLIPARAIGAPVAEPHLYRVVVRPLLQHHVRPREGVDQRDNLDLLAGRRVILCVEETETVEHGFDPFRLAAGRRLTVLQPQRDCDGRAAEEHHG
jgi:hypothetical protein